MTEIPIRVGIAYRIRRTMYLRIFLRSLQAWRRGGAPRVPRRVRRVKPPLWLDPPLLDVPGRVRAEAARLDAANALVGREDPVLGEAEVVRLILVQDLVRLLVDRLPDVLRAVPDSRLLNELV